MRSWGGILLLLCSSVGLSDRSPNWWRVYARILKFHSWVPYGKLADHIFILFHLTCSCWVMPLFKKLNWKVICLAEPCHVCWYKFTYFMTVQIQIIWLVQKPTDLDLHCLQRQCISGFSRTRVKKRHNSTIV